MEGEKAVGSRIGENVLDIDIQLISATSNGSRPEPGASLLLTARNLRKEL